MFTHLYILDEQGNPVPAESMEEWGDFMTKDNRHVAYDELLNIAVSTVFLGIDHNWTRKGQPILWETMVFNGDHNETMRRYRSKESALHGHNEVLKMVKQNVFN